MGAYEDHKSDKTARYIDSLKYGYRKFPPSLQIAPLDECFNRCPMCGHWKRKEKKRIAVVDLINFLKIGKALNLESVCYSGGDPFAYPTDELNDLMAWHISNNVLFSFVAAGYVPARVDRDLLRKAEFLSCSLDTIDESLYKRTRGGQLTAGMVTDCIKDLVKDEINIRISMVVHSANWKNIAEVFDFVLENNIKEVRIHGVRAHSNMDLKPYEQSLFFANTIHEYKKKFSRAGVVHNLDKLVLSHDPCCKFNRCFTTLYQLFIDSDGNIYPCCTTAGDTQENVRIAPLGSIYSATSPADWTENVWPGIVKFSEIQMHNLPAVCHTECKSRHAMINKQVGMEWNKKHFH